MKSLIIRLKSYMRLMIIGLAFGVSIACLWPGILCWKLARRHQRIADESLTKDLDAIASMDNATARLFLQEKIRLRIIAFKFTKSTTPRVARLFSVNDDIVNKIEEKLADEK